MAMAEIPMPIDLDTIERNPSIRYGFYLRPSTAMSRAQSEVHEVLRRQFGLEVGGKFMPHGTIMGFHRSDATIVELAAAIDGVLSGRKPFTITNRGPRPHGRSGISLDIHANADGTPNASLVDLHHEIFAALAPLAHPECEFAWGDWSRERFRAHLTLAMADIPDWLFDELMEFVRDFGQIGPHTFVADSFHLYAFQSDDWGGKWWDTMSWRDLAGWRLTG
jgi:2'-5' RNA ligase